MIEILLILILLCMFRTVRIFVGIMILLMLFNWPSHGQTAPAFTSDAATCSCVKDECNNACIRKADPEVIAALRRRFRDLDETDIAVLYDGAGGWDVIFWTSDAHRQCHLTRKLKLTKCRQVHA